ncbi:MAG: energy transducer TonB [Nitrospinae bacterium]|nr:energy transducer TonB [Nitrospinota bacterium]
MNWKDPAGGGDGRVKISFTLFPSGKISNPEIVKSSGDRKLDNLAVLAIKNAVPLPPFPKEIKEPNLSLTFEFTYVPSNS